MVLHSPTDQGIIVSSLSWMGDMGCKVLDQSSMNRYSSLSAVGHHQLHYFQLDRTSIITIPVCPEVATCTIMDNIVSDYYSHKKVTEKLVSSI